MSERMDEDRFRQLLNSLKTATNRAWQRRPCLAAAQFWKVALELGSYAPAEQQHLSDCPECTRRDQEVRGLAQLAAAPAKPAPILVAEQPLKAAAGLSKKSARASAGQRLNFPADPHLTAHVHRATKDTVVLDLEHTSWLPATLVRLTVDGHGPTASWTCLAPFCAAEGRVAARIVLRDDTLLKSGTGCLQVQPLSPGELTDCDVPLLCAALADASREAQTLSAWRECGKVLLECDKLAGAVRRAIGQGIKQLSCDR